MQLYKFLILISCGILILLSVFFVISACIISSRISKDEQENISLFSKDYEGK